MMMAKKRVTLFVDSEIYDNFKEQCDKKGWVVSKQFQNYMEKEVKKEGK
jgi:hypothetical protein